MGITGLSLAGGQSFVRVPGTRDYFMYQVRSRKSTKKVRILNGKPVMNVTISLEGNLLSKSNESVQLSNDVIHEIEQQLESQLLTGYQRFIADTQKKGSDIFGFGEYVRAKKTGLLEPACEDEASLAKRIQGTSSRGQGQHPCSPNRDEGYLAARDFRTSK